MLQLLKTKDNSFTLYNPELNETYHSRHGALQESLYVFIKQGLHHFFESNKKEVSILEIGFGTGLNALLTLLESEKLNAKINYMSLEPYPIAKDLITQLSYPEILQLNEDQKQLFYILHDGSLVYETAHSSCHFELIKTGLMQHSFSNKFDLIYFDAFAPEKQTDLWTKDVFNKCFELLNAKGILVTYCAKGEVKRTLKTTGFKVETLTGPPGKREMIRAVKI